MKCLKNEVVDAFQWTGDIDQTEDPEWFKEAIDLGVIRIVQEPELYIELFGLSGVERVDRGDWLINDLSLDIYTANRQKFLCCKAEDFDRRYLKLDAGNYLHDSDLQRAIGAYQIYLMDSVKPDPDIADRIFDRFGLDDRQQDEFDRHFSLDRMCAIENDRQAEKKRGDANKIPPPAPDKAVSRRLD